MKISKPKKIKITIIGRPASKKNSRRNFGHISLPSKAYERFRENALWQLKKVKECFTGSIEVNYLFKQKGNMSQDVDNAMASINDVLQDAGIIDDDKNIISGTFVKVNYIPVWETLVEIKSLEDLTNTEGQW